MTLSSIYLKEKSSCQVTYQGKPVKYLNALSYSQGYLFANIYMNIYPPDYPYYIVKIDPNTCKVTAIIPLFNIYKPSRSGSVLNGIIALTADELIITGKQWQSLFN
jgi:glutaminyl-peptide cyclotransferase